MPRKTVIIGGGAAGLGAAGGVKAADPAADVVVYTQYEDVAYSPCGIPYVHGGEIPDFERLFLAGKQAYVDAGIDVHYETEVTAIDAAARTVTITGEGAVRYDELVIATGWNYADPGVPGGELSGLYYVKNIRKAMEWDEVISETRSAVVVEAGPLGLEMVTALAHRGVETHLIDPNPYALSMMADPDIMAPVEESWRELGVHLHFNTTLEEFLGDDEGRVRALRLVDVEFKDGRFAEIEGTEREIPAELVLFAMGFVGPEKGPLLEGLGVELDARGNVARDQDFMTSVPGVFSAGDMGRGQSLIVWAISEGRAAAAGVDAYLTGRTVLPRPIAPTDRPLVA